MMRSGATAGSHAGWLMPGSKSFDLVRIYALSAVVGFFFLYFGNITVEHGAVDYIELAHAMVTGGNLKDQIINGNQGRDIGMSLIWLVSGYPLTHSLAGVIVIQVFAGMMMPLLAYLAIRPWFPRAAFYTAMEITISLAPFLLSKLIHHDQPYIFFTMLSVYLISRYMLKASPGTLYALSASIFGLGLIRQVGTGIYWLLVPIMGLRGGRKSIPHLALSSMLFLAASLGYSDYRTSLIGDYGEGLGIQLFYNFYINMSEYGLTFSPDLGPQAKFVLDRVYKCALPSPAQSPYTRNMVGPADFVATEFYDNTAAQFVQRVSSHSARAYYNLINGNCVADQPAVLNRILLGADEEIARAHPFYIVRLFFRNALRLLYRPGWVHLEDNARPDFKQNVTYEFGNGVKPDQDQAVGDDRLPQHAQREAYFIPMARRSPLFRLFYAGIYALWTYAYQPATIIMGCLAWFAWMSTIIGLLQKAIGGARLTSWAKLWLSEQVLPASIGVSVLLLANVAITAICVDPIYRYDFSILILKLMLAGIGCVVAIRVLQPYLPARLARAK